MRLVLASASPRRAELLKAAGFDFDVHPTDVDERMRPAEMANEYVSRLAVAKAAAVARLRPDALVIGADTAVVVGGETFGKPIGREDAERMLLRLSARTHDVLTAVALHQPAGQSVFVERTRVEMRAIDAELTWYLATGEWADKAGAYAIQGYASRFVLSIHGSYSNVVGLPIAQLCVHLEALGVLAKEG